MSEEHAPRDPFDVEISAECAELFAALAAFRGEVITPKKTAFNPHFGKAYVDLAEVLEAVREPMAKHGLAVIQIPLGSCATHVRVITIVAHKSGQSLKGVLDMPLPQRTPQAVGSAITYARRYCVMAMLSIAAEDDDAEAATPAPGPEQRSEQRRTSERKTTPAREGQKPARDTSGNATASPTAASVDEYGLTVPSHPCPMFTREGPNKGKRWDEVPGPLIEKMIEEHGNTMGSRQVEWGTYLVARRQARKAREARDAERANAESGPRVADGQQTPGSAA
jgi:hypothetical protein